MSETIDIKALITSGFYALESCEFKKAEQCFDLALSFDSKCFDAFLGKTLCHFGLASIEELKLVANANLLKHYLFAHLKKLANEENVHIIHDLEECISNKAKRNLYNKAKKDMETGFFEEAYNKFEQLGDYLDSHELYQYSKYSHAVTLFNNLDDQSKCSYVDIIIKLFNEVIDYKDSKEHIAELKDLKISIEKSLFEKTINLFNYDIPNDTSLVSIQEAARHYKYNVEQFKKIDYINQDIADIYNKSQKALLDYISSTVDSNLEKLKSFNDIQALNRSIYELKYFDNPEIKEIVFKVDKVYAKACDKKGRKTAAIVTSSIVGFAVLVASAILIPSLSKNSANYKKACNLMCVGKYDEAINIFKEIPSFKDSSNKVLVCEGCKIIDAATNSSQAMVGVKKIVDAGEKATLTFSTKGDHNISNTGTPSTSVTITYDKDTPIDYQGYRINVPDPGYNLVSWSKTRSKYLTGTTYIYFDANWKTITYYITYVLDGGENSSLNPSSYNVESKTITLYPASKEGYEFNGWKYRINSKFEYITEIPKGSVGDFALYAEWE